MPGKPIRLGRRARAVGPRSPGPGSDLASRAAVTGPGPWARASDSGPGPIGAYRGPGGSWGVIWGYGGVVGPMLSIGTAQKIGATALSLLAESLEFALAG